MGPQVDYGVVKITTSTLKLWERTDIEQNAHQNEITSRKEVEIQLKKCERRKDATNGPCWNHCKNPMLRVDRDESISINPSGRGPQE